MEKIMSWRNTRSKTVHLGGSRRGRGELGSAEEKILLPPQADKSSHRKNNKKMNYWEVIWKKLLREKKKIFEPSKSSARVHVGPYDARTYLQNFDQGLTWEEPENLCRSFSVRFADSSSSAIFRRSLSSYAPGRQK